MLDCLIIDDDAHIAATICEYFNLFNFSCTYETDLKGGIKATKEKKPSLIILDVNLGEESGFALCKELRQVSDVPIIFISVRNTDDDILAALSVGGDDYITKPFSMAVLLAKAKTVLKRSTPAVTKETQETQGTHDIIHFGGIEINRSNERVTRNGKLVKLKPLELKLLLYLIDHRGTRITKEELLEKVWGDTFIGEGTLSVHIRRLREKLEDVPHQPRFIKTVWGSGYLFEEPEE